MEGTTVTAKGHIAVALRSDTTSKVIESEEWSSQ